jgi:holo-[acyl-carrier protein] synthase
MEVVKMPGGWCELELHGDARQLAAQAGIHSFSVSLSHEQAYAVAVVAANLD